MADNNVFMVIVYLILGIATATALYSRNYVAMLVLLVIMGSHVFREFIHSGDMWPRWTEFLAVTLGVILVGSAWCCKDNCMWGSGFIILLGGIYGFEHGRQIITGDGKYYDWLLNE